MKKGKVVARVNQSILTEEELNDALPEFFGDLYSDSGKNEYVEQWVESEVLYQKALEEGLDLNDDIQRKVRQFKHMILGEEVLRRYLDGHVEITDEEVADYYNEHMDSFTRIDDEYRVNRLIFRDEEVLKEVLGELDAAPERYEELISADAYRGMIKLSDMGYYPAAELAEPFEREVKELGVGMVSRPVMASTGNYYVLRTTEFHEKGSIRELDEVEDQIRGILQRSRSEEVKRMWLEELENSADIETTKDIAD